MGHGEHLRETFGTIDVYLFGQLLRGRFDACRSILEIGCHKGRNLIYFLRNGFEVFGIDRDADAIREMQALASRLAPGLPSANFRVAEADRLPYADQSFDAVVTIAVLHFAEDQDHFERMLSEAWRVLKTRGILFARLASTIAVAGAPVLLPGRKQPQPDGIDRFLVDEQMLLDRTARLSGELLDPIKTVIVHGGRCMTTWCLRKPE